MKLLITAGPTREPIDPVRYLTNRSSGKMGYALVEAALEAGHEVVLVSGPVNLTAPKAATTVQVETAVEMYEAVAREIGSCDTAIFCAAVADYRVDGIEASKIKKTEDELILKLIKNPDILGSARSEFGFSGVLVGFAAETDDVLAHAQEKMERKGCDLLVANDVSRRDIGFDREENEVTLLFRSGESQVLSLASKKRIGREILQVVENLRDQRKP
ncbi:MAG: phosphopantothenoylcysteine decarboxylase [Verrucomicrobiales bacterium]|jgi:phosphopantothenate-cysteine ligase/phosphopantothenoylcysteine decarboxylase/phosphopantothenate--cysteine ligase|nr:phosphopantothenoylcysteine decarboxylase [Verrucomicrobiales bacterium]